MHKGLSAYCQTLHQDKDVVVVALKPDASAVNDPSGDEDKRTTVICFFYRSHRTSLETFRSNLATVFEVRTNFELTAGQTAMLICGDFNARDHTYTVKGDAFGTLLTDFMFHHDMYLVSTPHVITHVPSGVGQSSTIDLVFVDSTTRNVSCVTGDIETPSDHFTIVGELHYCSRRLLESIKPPSYNYRLADWDQLTQYVRDRMYRVTDVAEENVDGCAEALTTVLREATQYFIPTSEPVRQRNPWWMRELTKAKRLCKRLQRRFRLTMEEGDRKRYKDSQRDYRQLISSTRQAFIEKKLQGVDSNKKAWTLYKELTSPDPHQPLPDLSDAQNGMVTDPKAKLDLLTSTLIKVEEDAVSLGLEGHQYDNFSSPEFPYPYGQTGRSNGAAEERREYVSLTDIRRIIRRLPDRKAPGVDGIQAIVIKRVLPAIEYELWSIYNNCFTRGKYPKYFKESKVIFLRKPNKASYSDPKSFRPITLLPILAKILERVIAKQLTAFAEGNGMLHQNQFGFRKDHSTTDAVLNSVEKAERAFKKQKYLGVLAVDLKGSFNNCDHQLLIQVLRQGNVPQQLINIIKAFLSEKPVYGIADGHESRRFQLKSGVPQGSLLSPILFLTFIDPLLVKLNALPGIEAQGYADDTASFVEADKPAKCAELLSKAADATAEWADEYKMLINPTKTELIYLNRMRKGMTSQPVRMGCNSIQPFECIRYLGVHLDTGLKFKDHVNIVTAKARNQLYMYNSACKKTYGASLQTTRLFYRCAVFAIMTYAYLCWSTALDSVTDKLKAIQRLASLRSTGCVKTVSQAVLDKEMNILPMDLALKKLNLMETIRVLGLKGRNPVERYTHHRRNMRASHPTPLQQCMKELKERPWWTDDTDPKAIRKMRNECHKYVHALWHQRWDLDKDGRHLYAVEPLVRDWFWDHCRGLRRRDQVFISQCRTYHIRGHSRYVYAPSNYP